MKTGHHIITSPGHPWGWDATLEGYDYDQAERNGDPIGTGPTELSAIADLIDQLQYQDEFEAAAKLTEEIRAEYDAEKAMTPLPELDPRSSEYAERMCEQADMERKRIREEG